ncbi:ATP-binding protein [Sphingomonas sp. ASV193]|uniref:sensor histidine kinase n=1 Tax=Sphingomonas sp. ASV193 TaxID=3144405 RepID=UPI0032E8A75A
MISIAALWITLLLVGGGFALDRVLTASVTANFDSQLNYVLNAMIAASEIGPDGEVRFNRPLADQRFLQPYSGMYYQVTDLPGNSCKDPNDLILCNPSRSLWDRRLKVDLAHSDKQLHRYDSNEFSGEPLRVLERDVSVPGSKTIWRYQVAQSRDQINAQIKKLRETLVWSFVALGAGLLIMAALQTLYGLWPLRRIRREVAGVRSGRQTRIAAGFPREIEPLVEEINELLAHSEAQAEEARRHAGNLAHALKTPLTVINNAATAQAPDLSTTVIREAGTMRRQVDHHLARARAIGRRASAQARATVWDSVCAVERAVSVLYDGTTVDIAGDRKAQVKVERQDLDEMVGNLVENAAKYGGGRVFVTIGKPDDGQVSIEVEDDGPGIPILQRKELFTRGTRLDTTGKPGTGLGLAIVGDVARIYGGSVDLGESEDLGGLLVRLTLPEAPRAGG